MGRKKRDLWIELSASEEIEATLENGTVVRGRMDFCPSRLGGAFRVTYEDMGRDDLSEEGRGPVAHATLQRRARE